MIIKHEILELQLKDYDAFFKKLGITEDYPLNINVLTNNIMRTLENNQELNKQVKPLIEKCQDFENFFKEYQNLKAENVN